jgi:hypothetical protein
LGKVRPSREPHKAQRWGGFHVADDFEIGKAVDITTLSRDVESLKDEFRNLTKTAKASLVQQVEMSPLKSILIACGIGFLSSRLIRFSRPDRSDRPRPERHPHSQRRHSQRKA